MTALPENMSIAIDELETAIADIESRLESTRAERDESKARQVELEIENANLRRELNRAREQQRANPDEAREQQKATADILKVIASSPADVQPVFDTIADSARRLCGGHTSIVTQIVGDMLHLVASAADSEAGADELKASFPTSLSSGDGIHARAARSQTIAFRHDMENEPDLTPAKKEMARTRGYRSLLVVPMLREGIVIGTIGVSRLEAGQFSDSFIELLRTFADQAVIAIENARLIRETREALERQTATADILKVIASSPSDVQPVFEAIVSSAAKLFEPCAATITSLNDGNLHWAAAAASVTGFDVERTRSIYPLPFDPDRVPSARAILERRIIEIPDVAAPDTPEFTRKAAAAGGLRSITYVPLIDQDQGIGTIILSCPQTGFRFSERQLVLIQTFADQAVIAIQNARLFNETQEALERQTATADVLKVIASSPSDVQPVFAAIASSAKRLLGGFTATVLHFRGDQLHLVAFTPSSPEADAGLQASFPQPVADFPIFGLVRDGATIQFPDTDADGVPAMNRDLGRMRGFRSVLFVPLMNQGKAVGILSVTRTEPGAFADHHVQLLQTFADQAVIAIENTRLFNETKEALERQTATAEILKVIASSPSDTTPVFEAIANSAKRLLGGFSCAVWRFVEGNVHLAAFTPTTPAADAALRADFPQPVENFEAFRLAQHGEPFPIPDTEELGHAPLRDIARLHGFRSMIFVPLMSGGVPVGLIAPTRAEPGAFASHHVQLLQTFADQAVIAIENTRLFNETQEALERQIATADILKVIASSPSDVQPVFDAIARSAKRLIGGFSTAVHRIIDEVDHLVAFTPTNPESDDALKAAFPRHRSEMPAIISLVEKGETAQIADSEAADEKIRKLARARGWRSASYTPLMNHGTFIGFIVCTRRQTGMLADHHVQLLRTFADQAVIAIENARLFNETQEALAQQTATSDVLQVISSSVGDVNPVFEKMLENATRVCGAEFGIMGLFDGEVYRRVALYNVPADFAAIAPTEFRVAPDGPMDRILRTRQVVKIDDFSQDAGYLSGQPPMVAMVDAAGVRTLVVVPMLREGRPIGAISIYRKEVRQFNDKQIDLLKNFANQAVIAIENARLFNETREALERQTATADILKVIASSPSDVQPVFDAIAHSANRLIGGFSAAVFRYIDDRIHLAAFTPTDAEGDAVLQSSFPAPLAEFPPYQLTRVGAPAELPDTELEPAARDIARARGYRSMLFAPLMNDGAAVGIITVTRVAPGPFGEQHTHLLQMFADQAVIAIKNVGLFNEVRQRTEDLSEALQQQTATADVLKVISRSAFDLEIVLDTLTASAASLCNADVAAVARPHPEGGYHHATRYNFPPEWEALIETVRLYPDRGSLVGRVLLEGKAVQISDVLADPEYAFPAHQRGGGYRTLLGVPLLREGQPTGVLFLGRRQVEPFTDRQIELVQTYADQAVIAIENVRLFDEVQARTRELSEALTYQTGSANILKVIASSPTDINPVFQAIVESACELCDAYDAVLRLKDGDNLCFSAHHGPISTFTHERPINRDWSAGRAVIDQKPIQIADLLSPEGDEFPEAREIALQQKHRTVLSVPLLREGESLGTITLRRKEVHPFSDKQIALLQTFADQAVIAIGNVRLFEEVQAKTRELSEALTYQTGSANILKVIASTPTDVEPSLKAIVESACELCEAYDAVAVLQDGEYLRFGAHHGPIPMNIDKWPINRRWTAGRAFVDKRPVHVHDLLAEGDEFPDGRELSLRMGHRTILSVPLLRENESIGSLVLRRTEVNPFTDKQIALLQTFADQAVIAIGNVRLFEEVQQRTRELSESLQFQTASSEVLKVISSSPDALQPVLDAIVQTSRELCGSDASTIFLIRDGKFHFTAVSGDVPKHLEFLRDNPASVDEPLFGRLLREKRTLHFANVMDDPELSGSPRTILGGPRALLVAPLLRDGEAVGAIVLRQSHLKPFAPRQIQAIEVFADQAVIAISNVELFEEVQQRTRELSESLEQQVATSEVLQVISSSPGELEPVFQSMLANATRLCEAECGVMWLREGEAFRSVAIHGPLPPAYVEQWRSGTPVHPTPHSTLSILLQTGKAVHVADMREDRSYLERDPLPVAAVEVAGIRTLLLVPMSKEDDLVGGIAIYRQEVRPFADKQVELVSTFARQAVIAIENARLLKELRQRTDDLSKSLNDLRTAQDRLVQTEKLASLGQLTAGIAHEIKNPLNFVNNFAALSAELTDELKDHLNSTMLADTVRKEVDELTGLLKDNLAKVVQHGKRADSIIKNMLLHSREGSGEHRPTDINALVDESLNLAYHGARAEKSDFNVTLERDFDTDAREVDLFPQEITRVLLNLISNGFYAVTKRRKEGGEPNFEPTLRASTKNLGDSVEIRIRDNGTGIPPEVKEKMFNPFFTTKPAGEGTGLGLSMSHDIIVKQHGGTIDVDTEQGHFTEFRIVLPRTSNFADKSRG